MPIARKKIKLKELFFDADSYEIIKEAGKTLCEEFDIAQLEGKIFGAGDYHIEFTENELIEAASEKLLLLDQRKPFLKFREHGQHYAYELFLSHPKNWGSRGAPFFWVHLAREFSRDKLPMSEIDLVNKYLKIVRNYNIPLGKDEYVLVPEFAFGGISSGYVGGVFAKEALDTLIRRLYRY